MSTPPPPPGPTPSTTPGATAEIRTMATTMLRGGLWPGVVVAVLAIVAATVLAGGEGVVPAVVGAVLALVVCSLGPLMMRWTSAVDPLMVMGLTMISFVTKIGVLAVLFLVLRNLEVLNTRYLALALGAAAIAFIVGETAAFVRARPPALGS